MIYGYIRVSTEEQNPERQQVTMRDEGVEHVFIDHASGKDFDRPEYARMLTVLQPGDTIVIDSLDRLGRDYDGLISEWKRLTHDLGVDIRALDMPFMDSEYFGKLGDLGKLVEDMFLGILSWVAEHERLENRRRQAEGIARAREAGKYTGRKPKGFPPETLAEASAILANVGVSAAAGYLGVTRSTVYNMIRDGRLTA